MKRKAVNNPTEGRKNQHLRLKEVESVYDQVKQYHLVTARFPIDALTPKWSIGTNRPINEAHKRRLCQIFKDVGVLRQDVSHRLQVACTKGQVQQMLDHLKEERSQAQRVIGTGETAQEADRGLPLFEDWSSVVKEKAELMAGNHRVEALKEYLRFSQASQVERWWVCDVYDKDALPPHLHIKLRANREDPVLPDNHGQIWTELVTLSSNNNKLFQDSNKVIEQQMLEHLGLSTRVKFPVRRLATLWKNKNWNPMITRWCQFAVGQASFTISTFEWMASCRVDDFWFAAFNQVIDVVSQIRSQLSFDIQLTDWNKLAGLPQMHTQQDVRDLFYPGLESEAEPLLSSTRRPDFLPIVDGDVYYSLYGLILSEPGCRFVNIQSLLKTTKQEGKVMSIVIAHVSQWINKEPTKVVDRDNNKPALRKDLVPGLQEKYGEEAEEKSKVLQQLLLDHVRDNTKEFTSTAMEHYLHEYPNGHSNTYGTRFEHAVWKNLLSIVVGFAGPTLQHKCMVYFNADRPGKILSEPSRTIAQTARDLICQIPDVTKNPALQSKSATDKLCAMIQPVIAQWVSEQCAEGLERYGEDWQASTIEFVEAERAKSDALLDKQCLLRLPPSRLLPTLSPLLSGARKEEDAGNCHRRPRTHGPSKEQVVPVTPTFNASAPLSTVLQPRNSIDLTADGLRDLRKLHRSKKVVRQQEPQRREDPSSLSIDQQRDIEGPRVLHTIRGSKHWRRLATASHSRR